MESYRVDYVVFKLQPILKLLHLKHIEPFFCGIHVLAKGIVASKPNNKQTIFSPSLLHLSEVICKLSHGVKKFPYNLYILYIYIYNLC